MSHVCVPVSTTSNGGWHDAETASCGACGGELDVYRVDPHVSGKNVRDSWVVSHRLEDCIRHLASQLNRLVALHEGPQPPHTPK